MLATLGGALALAAGVAVLLLPVVVGELSRPRDAVWGAVVLLLGLVLVTSAERLTGAPMLAVLSGGLLIGRLGSEVGLARWRQLTEEERQRLGSAERWRSSLGQLGASLAGLAALAGGVVGGVGGALSQGRKPRRSGKRWVRPETEPPVEVVRDFGEIDERLQAAAGPRGEPMASEPPGEASAESPGEVAGETPTEAG